MSLEYAWPTTQTKLSLFPRHPNYFTSVWFSLITSERLKTIISQLYIILPNLCQIIPKVIMLSKSSYYLNDIKNVVTLYLKHISPKACTNIGRINNMCKLSFSLVIYLVF